MESLNVDEKLDVILYKIELIESELDYINRALFDKECDDEIEYR